MKAIVTGGAGFIGSHLVDRLLVEGNEVTVIDDLSTGTLRNLDKAFQSDSFRFIQENIKILKRPDYVDIMDGADAVFHLSSFADLRKSLINKKQDFENNLVPTLQLLDAIAENSVKNVIFASTSSIYGEPEIIPTPESYFPTITSLYSASKLASEAFCQAYSEMYGFRLNIFRFSNIIGDRCRRGVVWDFVHKLTSNPLNLEVLGDGKQSKEFLHVVDAINAVLQAFRHAGNRVSVYNVGSSKNLTIDFVADIVMKNVLGKKVDKIFTGGKGGWIGDNPIVALDLTRIKSIGWTQTIDSVDAIMRTVNWTLKEINSGQ